MASFPTTPPTAFVCALYRLNVISNARVLACLTACAALLLNVGAQAQDHDHNSHDHGSAYGGSIEVSAEARQQLDAAKAAIVSKYADPEAAAADGWSRPRSSTPTMGEHWTNRRLVADPSMDPAKPEILMYAPINGELTLVGASWMNRQGADEDLPQLFDGMDAMWHRHDASDELNRAQAALAASRGQRGSQRASGIVMNHLWFIDAQDGEFTGHNHWMPFMDAGLPVPPASITGDLLAHAALALGEVNGSAFIVSTYYDMLEAPAQQEVDGLREQIRSLIPEYMAAHEANEEFTMMAILGEMGALWTDIRAVHQREFDPAVANLLDVAYGNMAAGHQHAPGMEH